MGLMLFDTSAIVGTLERRNPNGRGLIDASAVLPSCHFVSLGELSAGVRRSRGAADVVVARQHTLDFARRMPPCPTPGSTDVEVFGLLVASTSRKLSHNDQWIVASAVVHGLTLVTEDHRMHDVAADESLHRAITSELGFEPLRTTLI